MIWYEFSQKPLGPHLKKSPQPNWPLQSKVCISTKHIVTIDKRKDHRYYSTQRDTCSKADSFKISWLFYHSANTFQRKIKVILLTDDPYYLILAKIRWDFSIQLQNPFHMRIFCPRLSLLSCWILFHHALLLFMQLISNATKSSIILKRTLYDATDTKLLVYLLLVDELYKKSNPILTLATFNSCLDENLFLIWYSLWYSLSYFLKSLNWPFLF